MPTLLLNSALLLAAVKQAATVVATNPVVPIVENVLLDVSATLLSVHASNLETNLAVRVPLPEGAASESFAICLPAKLLLSTLSALPSQPIALHVDLDTYATTVRAGKGRYQFAGENAGDWPRPTVGKPRQRLLLPAAALAPALLATAPFASTDNVTRPEMCTVLLDLRAGGLARTVTTDGHRMVWHTLPLPTADEASLPYQPGRYLLPNGAAKILGALCSKEGDSVTLELGDWLRCTPESGAWQLETRLHDGRYPDYENVIPLHNPNQLVVDKATLKTVLRSVTGFANETTNQIRLTMPTAGAGQDAAPVLTISAENLDFSHEAQDELLVDYEGEGMQIGFNAKFLEAALAVLPDGPLQLHLSTPNRAGLFRAGDQAPDTPGFTEFLLMPVVLNNFV